MTDDLKEAQTIETVFAPDTHRSAGDGEMPPWKLLIVDDEEEVHKLTRLILEEYEFEGRRLRFFSAYSAEEAGRILREHPDTALILLDVVMETDDAGLMLVRHIREEMHNHIVQIILRTGQPGLAPPQEAIARYEINDYKSKVELTAEKTYTTITASLRAYRLSHSLHQLNLQLQCELEERRRSQEMIHRLTQFQENIIENADVWLSVMDEQGNVLVWNRAAEKISGYDRSEILNKGAIWEKLFPEGVREQTIADFMQVVRDNREIDGLENSIVCKNGQIRNIAWNVKRLEDRLGKTIGATILGRDVTEQRMLESQFRQAQKMEAIGRMAGGVAHDFNNILTVIRGYCDLSRIKLNPKDPFYTRFIQIDRAAGRGEQLTRQLLAFSRNQVMKPKAISLASLMIDMQKMLHRLIGEEIELVVRIDEHSGYIKADPGHIEQIVMNLAVNARDAMPGGGSITIEIRNAKLGSSTGENGEDDYVMLSMTDTGCGMDAETQEKIFEPFFTTKDATKGTGLGLSTVFGIVNQSRGRIVVESEPGRGATFRIYFPRIEKREPREIVKPALPEQLTGSETVLIVEDQAEVLRLASETLQMHGYRVLEALNADSALAVHEKNRELIDLVLTDIIMPKMNGIQLAAKLHESAPYLKILFMSGYPNIMGEEHGLLDPGRNFLQKPFTTLGLLRMVRGILDSTD